MSPTGCAVKRSSTLIVPACQTLIEWVSWSSRLAFTAHTPVPRRSGTCYTPPTTGFAHFALHYSSRLVICKNLPLRRRLHRPQSSPSTMSEYPSGVTGNEEVKQEYPPTPRESRHLHRPRPYRYEITLPVAMNSKLPNIPKGARQPSVPAYPRAQRPRPSGSVSGSKQEMQPLTHGEGCRVPEGKKASGLGTICCGRSVLEAWGVFWTGCALVCCACCG